MNEDIDKCLSIGFTSFLSKPCRKELVRSMVKQYVVNPVPQNPLSPTRFSSQRRVVMPTPMERPILGNANGQIVASLSQLPPGVIGTEHRSSMKALHSSPSKESLQPNSRPSTPTQNLTSIPMHLYPIPSASTSPASSSRPVEIRDLEVSTLSKRRTITIKEAMTSTPTEIGGSTSKAMITITPANA
jgi:hypothetical protein